MLKNANTKIYTHFRVWLARLGLAVTVLEEIGVPGVPSFRFWEVTV